MKTLVLVITAALTWLSTTIAFAQWPQTTYDGRMWEWNASARIMERPGTDMDIGLLTDALTNEPLFDSEDATDLETSVGVELNFVRKTNFGIEWEFRTFVDIWETEQTFTSVNNLESPFFDPIRAALPPAAVIGGVLVNIDGIDFNSLDYDYDSNIFNVELNARRTVLPGVTLLAGPRFLYLEDTLDTQINATINGNVAGVPVTAPFTQNTRVETENPMIGFQIGADVAVPVSQSMFVTGFIKAGGYGNTARATLTTFNSLQPAAAVNSFRRSQGSFIGEVGGKVNFEIIPGCFSVSGGYQAMWLDNVAIAPNQLTTAITGFSRVEVTGTPFIHGLVFGATFRR